MKRGKLVVEAGSHGGRSARVYVEPDDGSEAIFLGVLDVVIDAQPHRPVVASLKARIKRVDVAGIDADQKLLHFKARSEWYASYPDAELTDVATCEPMRARSATWYLRFDGFNYFEVDPVSSPT